MAKAPRSFSSKAFSKTKLDSPQVCVTRTCRKSQAETSTNLELHVLWHDLQTLQISAAGEYARCRFWRTFSKESIDQNETAKRLWINAFLFRVVSMSLGSPKFVLSVEQSVLLAPGNFYHLSVSSTSRPFRPPQHTPRA